MTIANSKVPRQDLVVHVLYGRRNIDISDICERPRT